MLTYKNFTLIYIESTRFKQAVARGGILLVRSLAELLTEIESGLDMHFVIACGLGACKSEMWAMFWLVLLDFLR